GPANQGGLKVMDVITALDGTATDDMSQFLSLLWQYKVGDEIEVTFVSDRSPKVTSVVLAERPSF
ncbi:MAG: PDZ domain-containing protein, partial [Chloroflexota bacterium]|nr:PDZ domain-containing protein [Chloroflexota bacterium]